MYSIIKTPALYEPFTEPRNTTEQFKIFSERLTIVFVGSHTLARIWKLRSAARLYQPVTLYRALGPICGGKRDPEL